MKLSFKDNPQRVAASEPDPRRGKVEPELPVTYRPPPGKLRHAANWASTASGFIVIFLVAGLALADVKLELWGLDRETYALCRLLVFLVIVMLGVLDAFQNSPIFGFLCFFPPFLLYYGLVMADSAVLRGLFLGMVAFFGVEMLAIPKHSFLAETQQAIRGVIDGGHHWLSNANRAP